MSVEFEPVRIGRRRRRVDPVAAGLLVVVAALGVAVVKPWGSADSGVVRIPSASPAAASPSPLATMPPPDASALPGLRVPPTWADVAAVAVRREAWGVRSIVLSPAATTPAGRSPAYLEHWVAVAFTDDPVVTDPSEADVMAVGVTFPLTEAPLGVRIWLERRGGELQWVDAQPVNATPAWGAYLFVRPTPAGDAPQSWEAGRYWVDVLVGSEIRRFALHILDPTGRVPAPPPWPEIVPEGPDLPGTGPAGLPVGPFAWVAGTAVPLQADAGPPLDSASAWLDLDDVGTSEAARSFVARAYQPGAEWLGVVLPSRSTIRAASLRRLAPLPWDGEPGVTTTTTSGEDLSFVAFERAGGALWRPGVYAIRIEFEDGAGSHDLTWHVELRPGPLGAEPVLLSATRAWANLAGSTGILLGTTEPADGEPASAGVRLIVIDPEAGATYAGLGGAHLFGCGQTLVRGRPTLLGFVGPVADNLAPVTATILFPFADAGSLPILTAAGSVPGLAVAAPVLTAEFGGPASYGFRAGQSPDATGYTICIGMAGSGG